MAGIGRVAAAPQDDQEQPDASGAAPDSAQPGQDAGQDQTQDQPQGGDEPNVSPEEQAQYDQFVGNGMQLVYQEQGKTMQVAPAVLGQLKGDWKDVEPSLGQIPQEEKPLDPKNPIDCLAVTTVGLVLTLEASAASSNHQLDPAVVFHGGAELMEQLADIANAANIHDFSDDEMTGAANRAAMLYGVSSKSMNKQEALAEFDHFLKTQGDQLGQSLAAASGGADQGGDQQQAPQQGPPQQQEQ
jgi:hypothetical protein